MKFNCGKNGKIFMQNKIETVQKILKIGDIIIKEKRNRQPKITYFISKTQCGG